MGSDRAEDRARVTLLGGLWRVGTSAIVGAFAGAVAMTIIEGMEAPDPSPLSGYAALFAPVLGAFVGACFGAVAGWCWLVMAVNREKRSPR